MYHFDRFVNEIIITGKLQLITPLHIGAGSQGIYDVDNGVVKTLDGAPYIPGSSLKGILRTFLERLGQSSVLDHTGYAKPCQFGEKSMCLSEYRNKSARDQLLEELNNDEEKFQQFLAEHSCPICHLFGNQLRGAKVRVADAHVDETWNDHYDIRQGVGIDRDTGKAADKVLYDFEVVPAGTRFVFQVRGENLSSVEERWLVVALEALRQGRLILGGKSARGLGLVQGVDWQVEQIEASNFINRLLSPAKESVPFEEYVQKTLKGVS